MSWEVTTRGVDLAGRRGPYLVRSAGELRSAMRGWSSEPGCSCDQEQPCSEDDGSDASRYALTSRCKTFEGDGCRHTTPMAADP
jgi:hypothetical protein